jgi:hypothetical protein
VLWLGGLLCPGLSAAGGSARASIWGRLLAEDIRALLDRDLLMLLAMSVMAPFYVAAGFALYLGRRTRLEAWDLELAFGRAPPGACCRVQGFALVKLSLTLALLLLLPPIGQASTRNPPRRRPGR